VKSAPNDEPSAAGVVDPLIAVPGGNTAARGGAWLVDAANARAASRVGASDVDRAFKTYGFRLFAPTDQPANDDYNWKTVDLSGATDHHVIVAAGTPTEYQGHPTTALMADGKTVYCTWPTGHGGYAGKLAVSHDAGKTWKRCDERLPRGAERNIECPLLHRLTGPDGKERLWIWSGYRAAKEHEKTVEGCADGAMPSLMSEDGGLTWRKMPPLGATFRCVLSFQAVLRLKDGSYLGLYHRGPRGCVDGSPLELLASVTKDGGFTWSTPRVIAKSDDLDFCEPWMFRSPDGKEICCLLRENRHSDPAKVIFSRDEGQTWTEPRSLPHVLAGHRHQGVVLPDGRILVCMRDAAATCKSPTNGHLVCWIGSYETIRTGAPQPGDYRVKLIHSYAGWDCGYPGVHQLPDGTILVTTYVKYRPGKDLNSIVSVRFRVEETDALR